MASFENVMRFYQDRHPNGQLGACAQQRLQQLWSCMSLEQMHNLVLLSREFAGDCVCKAVHIDRALAKVQQGSEAQAALAALRQDPNLAAIQCLPRARMTHLLNLIHVEKIAASQQAAAALGLTIAAEAQARAHEVGESKERSGAARTVTIQAEKNTAQARARAQETGDVMAETSSLLADWAEIACNKRKR